ncbi:MAG TPA: hypothetical protein EYP09_02615 [Anaerolineae bacterium]|nr:hypothetical protein [Anaerolineae bacterium]
MDMVPIRISPKVHTALKVLAAATGVTMRSLAEEAIKRGIREEASGDQKLAQAIELILEGEGNLEEAAS